MDKSLIVEYICHDQLLFIQSNRQNKRIRKFIKRNFKSQTNKRLTYLKHPIKDYKFILEQIFSVAHLIKTVSGNTFSNAPGENVCAP
jgi:hypothetical protein